MMQAICKLFDIVRDRRKTLKKEIKRKMKIAIFFFLLLLFYKEKNYILLVNTFGKT